MSMVKGWRTLYIVPADLCRVETPRESRPTGQAQWGTHGVPGDPTIVLLDVEWEGDPNARTSFESLPGVLPLGFPWEPLPAEAVAPLAAIQTAVQASNDAAAKAAGTAILTVDAPAPTDSVARALQKMGRNYW